MGAPLKPIKDFIEEARKRPTSEDIEKAKASARKVLTEE
jgi:hypothetical protein